MFCPKFAEIIYLIEPTLLCKQICKKATSLQKAWISLISSYLCKEYMLLYRSFIILFSLEYFIDLFSPVFSSRL